MTPLNKQLSAKIFEFNLLDAIFVVAISMLWFCDRTLNYPAVGQRCDSASDSSLPTSRPVHTDFSNNLLEDAGVRHLCEALCEQTRPSGGLAILVLWNNRLKSGSALHFNKALVSVFRLILSEKGF